MSRYTSIRWAILTRLFLGLNQASGEGISSSCSTWPESAEGHSPT
jgi:hypothetical protein